MSGEALANEVLESFGGDDAGEAGSTSQFVAFRVGEQHYCVDIMLVREIQTWTGTTPLPNTADFVRGVINLRGIILPIVDLRARFGMGGTKPTKYHVVVIVAVGARLVGLLVDSVMDILTVQQGEIAPIPDTGGDERTPYLESLITQNGQMVAVIALKHLINQLAT